MSTTGRGRGDDEDGSPAAPPIPSFASLRAPRRTHAALDVLLPPAAVEEPRVAERPPAAGQLPFPVEDAAVPAPAPPTAGPAPVAAPRPAEWPDLLRFGVRVASAVLRLPGALVREPVCRLRRLLGE